MAALVLAGLTATAAPAASGSAASAAPAAPAADGPNGLDKAAAALRDGPVYVDPRAADQLSAAEADRLARTIERADAPVFVAVLPDAAEFDPQTLFQDLRTKVGVTGVYAVALGDRFAARADSSVMSQDAVTNLSGAVERSDRGDVRAMVTEFADQAAQQADGQAPASWDGAADRGTGTGGVAVLIGLLAVLAVITGGALVAGRNRRKRRAERDREQLETLRPVVDEDITAFGEELDRIDFSPSAPAMDDAMRADYQSALDSYENAKSRMDAARRPHDVRKVTEALEDGRFALATLEARRDGGPLPERRAPCFFDPRHGPSVKDEPWSPAGGTERMVPVCAADAARLAEGTEPDGREVDTPSGRRPYWEAGPAYGPWAYGYFGGGLLPGLLTGTMLGSMLSGPYAYGGGFGAGDGGDAGGDYGGGDASGADFNSGDFGGFGGGFGGGGDFGGGF
ncbi:hypothetical protein DVA86_25930 [Streptomyces armeniacus]|uniref:TPM domain-containing protein n=1 Tax=Streptomyces armeniacus TaxID=83291 RepID=A0A345Y186_9ACTN|nr:hypothetical protein DVA86_25930 [Streptomyces armeniacus]